MTETPGPATAPVDWGEPAGERYSIRQLVELTGVPASSVHHYRRLGLVPEPQRTALHQSAYDDRHVTALAIVRSLRRRGCALAEIRDVLPDLLRAHGAHSAATIGPELAVQVGDRTPEAKLVNAAIEAFGERSFREVSITELCARADVAKGTFYRCFDSKEALFLAAARAIVEQATSGFEGEAAGSPEAERPAVFARHLRPGLPVLFELAKRVTQESGPTAGEAVTMFAGLARRLGRTVSPEAADEQAEQSGGLLIILALVRIFEELLQSEITPAGRSLPGA